MADMQIVLASSCKNVEAQHVDMMVPLYSHGCEKKVKKTLSHLKGIYSVNVEYYQQKVTVWGICNKQDVLATIKTKRKEARFWNPQDSTQMEESQPPPPPPPKDSNRTVPSLTLMKARSLTRSLSLKVWKKVFTRTNSF